MNDIARRLDAAQSQRLVELARACRAAARAVALYPQGHRAVEDAVGRLTEVARRAAGEHALAIDVMPAELRIHGLAPDRDDAALAELAGILHAQQIGGVTLHATADRESWQALLALLSRPADDNRRDGGLAHLWKTAGGPSIEVHAIDYAALLREGHGGSLSRLLRAATEGALAAVSLADLEAIIDAVEGRQASAHHDDEDASDAAGLAIARLGSLVLSRGAADDPARVESALRRLAQITERLSPDGMRGLVAARGALGAGSSAEEAAGADEAARGAAAVLDHMDAAGQARFVAAALVAEGSATSRLREAFEALVPADDRRRVASLADSMLASSGAPLGDVPRLRQELDMMVVSYDDRAFVGGSYARELTAARGRAEDLETARPDPSERIEAWLATVSDSALRGLDLQVLIDLLSIPGQAHEQFAALAAQAGGRIEDFARVGLIDPALALERALEAAREAGGEGGAAAGAALDRLRRGSLVRDLIPLVRRAPSGEAERVTGLLARLGPAIAPALAAALAHEADPAARERLRAVLAGFGDAGEQAVRALLASDHAETRRNAALLLRDFGGAASIDVLEGLLADHDPRVRREALRALAVVDDAQAHARILHTLGSVPRETQRALLDELGLVRDARISPLLARLATRWRERRLSEAALRAMAMLGMLGAAAGPDAIDALASLLDASQWWSPARARNVREHAAAALAQIGTAAASSPAGGAAPAATADARAALEAAVARGGKGARAATQALARRQA
jgi:hypothetical protein